MHNRDEVANMIAMDFPDTFLGYPLTTLLLSWCCYFEAGSRISNLVRPQDMPEAITACKYYDEIPPIVAWNGTVECYEITRRRA